MTLKITHVRGKGGYNEWMTLKLGTHTQVPNTNTPAKFQGHPLIITTFTPHMCDFQGH